MTDERSGRDSCALGHDADPAETGDEGTRPLAPDGGRDRVEVPDEIEMPRLLDFYEQQTPADTRIHEFYERLAAGELSTTECDDCGSVHFPPRIVCPECLGEDLSYVPLPDRGDLFAFSEVRGSAPLGMEDEVPFVVAIVDLGDVRLSARIEDARCDDLEIGDPVELKVVDVVGGADHERAWYRFVPTTR